MTRSFKTQTSCIEVGGDYRLLRVSVQAGDRQVRTLIDWEVSYEMKAKSWSGDTLSFRNVHTKFSLTEPREE